MKNSFEKKFRFFILFIIGSTSIFYCSCNNRDLDVNNLLDYSWFAFYPSKTSECENNFIPAFSELIIDSSLDGFIVKELHPLLIMNGRKSFWEIKGSRKIGTRWFFSDDDQTEYIEFVDPKNIFIKRRQNGTKNMYLTIHYHKQDFSKEMIKNLIVNDEYSNSSFCRGLERMNQFFENNFYTFSQ